MCKIEENSVVMKLLRYFLSLFLLVAFASGATKTTVYVTATKDGKKTVVPTLYEQKFSTYSDLQKDEISSGSVGLGSLTGDVGKVRSYSHTTVKNIVPELYPQSFYLGLLGISFLIFGVLL